MSGKSIQAAAMVVFCLAGFALGEEPSRQVNELCMNEF